MHFFTCKQSSFSKHWFVKNTKLCQSNHLFGMEGFSNNQSRVVSVNDFCLFPFNFQEKPEVGRFVARWRRGNDVTAQWRHGVMRKYYWKNKSLLLRLHSFIFPLIRWFHNWSFPVVVICCDTERTRSFLQTHLSTASAISKLLFMPHLKGFYLFVLFTLINRLHISQFTCQTAKNKLKGNVKHKSIEVLRLRYPLKDLINQQVASFDLNMAQITSRWRSG